MDRSFAEPAGIPGAEEPAIGRVRGGGPWVLVIDDDAAIRKSITQAVRRVGYNTLELADDFHIATVIAAEPALIILDVALKNSDAVDVIQTLSALNYGGPVLLVSGAGGDLLDDIKAIGARKGIHMLPPVRKPFRAQQLAALIESYAALPPPVSVTEKVSPSAGNIPEVTVAEALERDWMRVWYQPKLSLETGKIVGAECLCRILHPEAGLIPPGHFLSKADAEEMEALTRFVLQCALLDRRDFRADGLELRLAVNIPVRLLSNPSIVTILREFEENTETCWRDFVFEITEEEALRNIELAHDVGTQLRIYGIDLSVDDFGTGYSSLARLRELPFKEIKVDRSFVNGVAADPVKAAMCRMVIELAHALGAKAVAEGVETAEDLDLLRRIGCDMAQGYLMARPMPKAQFVQFAGDNI